MTLAERLTTGLNITALGMGLVFVLLALLWALLTLMLRLDRPPAPTLDEDVAPARPETGRSVTVPPELLSGHHAQIARWRREQDNHKNPGGDHGEQTLHPVIVGDAVYAEPCAYDLATGQPLANWTFNRGGHGCGTMSASAHQLFYRAGNPAMLDLRTGQASRLSTVSRPGCWINIIPAGGLVLVPEASSGCTCGFPVQTSYGFAPRGGW